MTASTPPTVSDAMREAVARCQCGAEIDPNEVFEPGVCDPCSARRFNEEAAAHRNPAPQPIPVRARFYMINCEHCDWVGSSEQCGTDAGQDDSEVYCPVCCQSMLCEEPSEADTAKHGQAVFDRIAALERENATLRAERNEARQESLAILRQSRRADEQKVEAEDRCRRLEEREDEIRKSDARWQEKAAGYAARATAAEAKAAALQAERDEAIARAREPIGDTWDQIRHLEGECRTFIRESNEWKAVADRAEAKLASLRASAERMEAAHGWLPINSAPTDGTRVDIWDGNCRRTDCHYADGRWLEPRDRRLGGVPCFSSGFEPTHWRQRPCPPARAALTPKETPDA